MGLGTRGGGVGVARYLAEHGRGRDRHRRRRPRCCADPWRSWRDCRSGTCWAGTRSAISLPSGADMIVRNPGVPRRAPLLELAAGRRASRSRWRCRSSFAPAPRPSSAITGTKGKTTTSATLRRDAARLGSRQRSLAGNMGVTALGQLDAITPDDAGGGRALELATGVADRARAGAAHRRADQHLRRSPRPLRRIRRLRRHQTRHRPPPVPRRLS